MLVTDFRYAKNREKSTLTVPYLQTMTGNATFSYLASILAGGSVFPGDPKASLPLHCASSRRKPPFVLLLNQPSGIDPRAELAPR